jgi:iron complex outermembrane receptor protein
MKNYIIYIIILVLFSGLSAQAQEKKYDFENMTRKEIMEISYDDMLEMPFEELKKMAEAVGVSTDELLKMALNREVSSASKKGESVFESPLSTTVITKEEIQLTGATTYEELFRLVPGMIVRQESNGNFDVHIRGNDNLPPGNFSHFSENMMTLVMVDGRIVYNYINGGTIWESLPVSMSDIERIEIIRGASSALYGPNAVSGVINIITRRPDKEGIQVHGDFQAGTNNTYIGNFSFLNNVSDKIGFKFSGAYDFRDRFQDDFYEYESGEYVPADSLTSMFGNPLAAKSPNSSLSKKTFSGNAGLFYDLNQDVSMSLNTGWQSSESQSTFFENLATPFGIRKSETTYLDYVADAYGVKAQINYLYGSQNLHEKMIKPVIEYDMNFLSANVEYDLVLNDLGIGELTVRPGFNYQLAAYTDKKYVEEIDTVGELDQGLLNGEKKLETVSGSMRIDYKPISSLRLIAALRADKYNYPDDIYFSWQFVAAYNLNSKHFIRGTYSRANRGSFMGNTYSNFRNILNENTPIGQQEIAPGVFLPILLNYNQYYIGSEELSLLTQDLIEIGYRGILTDYLQIDIEGFYSTSKDFDALLPADYTLTPPAPNATMTAIEVNIEDEWHYQNIDMKSKQLGASANISVQPMDNLMVKLFGTVQSTKLTNVLKDISSLYYTDPDGVLPLPSDEVAYEDLEEKDFKDSKNKWTPSFYGGFMVNYAPIKKLNFNLSGYYYGEQTYSRYFYDRTSLQHTTMSTTLDPNIILNAKIAYRVTDNFSIYINARNLLSHGKTEMAYNDKINGLYMGGISFNF